MGDTIGGLINATFGNAVEIIIMIFALKQGEIELVQSSLIGSLLSNILLVLGMCFMAGWFGGNKSNSFNKEGASINMSLLFVSSFAMLIPSYYKTTVATTNTTSVDNTILSLSHISAIFLIMIYFQLLVFQLITHRPEADQEAEKEVSEISPSTALCLILVCTCLVAVFSEFLVSSIDGFTASANISKSFVGIILLPIVGNAVEHVTAVRVAFKNNMELAMGVAVGSATQISLMVVPVAVLAGWIMDQPMTLAFNGFEAITFLFSVLIVYVVVSDGSSNWLEGSVLLTIYGLIGLALLEIGD